MSWQDIALLTQPLPVIVLYLVLRLNDLRHLSKQVEELRADLKRHLEWHMEQ
jgi:hypothetical protein